MKAPGSPEPRKWSRFAKIVRVGVAVYAGLALAAFFFGERLVFFPDVDGGGDWTLPIDTEDVRFRPPQGPLLHAWFLRHPESEWTVIVFHGNAGNIAGRRETYEQLRALSVNVLAVDYRGYGRSEGAPSEEGVYDDGVAAWEYLVRERKISPERIVVMGQSLGSAVATHVAASRQCAGVILEAPMANAAQMASKMIPFPPLGWALRVKLDNLDRIGLIRCPLLIVHGTKDGVIPFDQGQQVFRAAMEPKTFVALKGGDHNDLWEGATGEYMDAITTFLESCR